MTRNENKVVKAQIKEAIRLGDLPANKLTPTDLAREATASQPKKVKTKVLGEVEMAKLGMNLLLGVSRGSDEEAKLIVLEFMNGKKGDKPTVLIGKGLTFDMGGNSIKPASGLHQMKYDMLGAGSVLAAFNAAVELDLKINLVVIIPSSENLINGRATKPGDVHESMNGITVDIRNTDAEGRLILGDALAYAQAKFDAESITTVATLTGAVMYALGTVHSALFGNKSAKALIRDFENAGNQSKDLVWNMPLLKAHADVMKGIEGISDLINSEGKAGPGSTTAAAFLNEFVDEDIPFTHLDIAATASQGDTVTGRPVKLLVQFLINKAK